MSDYQLLADGRVLRLRDGACIPDAADNADWQVYQAWLADGDEPLPAPEPPVQPAQPVYISKLDILRRLKAMDKLGTMLTVMAQPANIEAKALWDACVEVDIEDVMVREMLSAIGADPDVILAAPA